MAVRPNIPPLDRQSQIVDSEGMPTQLLITLWNLLINRSLSQLVDVNIPNPTDGQVLTYSAAEGRWIAS
jgi:hypothetical protein